MREVLLLVFVALVHGWGPVSHITFVDRGLGQGNAVPWAADMPDGFFGFMSPGFSYAPYAGACPNDELFHDPVFAATIFLKEHNKNKNSASPSAYEKFLASYMSHMIGDMVGFNVEGGYLATNISAVNWTTMWLKMQAIDAFLQNTTTPVRSIPNVDETIMKQFASDVASMSNLTYSASTLITCANGWLSVQNSLLQLYLAFPQPPGALLAALDVRPNVTPQQTIASLVRAVSCASRAVQTFYLALTVTKQSPKAAYDSTTTFVSQLMQQGQCL